MIIARINGGHMYVWPWCFKMKYLHILSISFFIFLSGCGDDLSGLPDPDQKAPAVEPDSFTFASATEIDVDMYSGESVDIHSQVSANQTRHYQFEILYYNAGNGVGDLASLTLVTPDPDGNLQLAWYDANQELQQSDAAVLDFTTINSSFPTHQINDRDYYKIFFTVENSSEIEMEYQLEIKEIPRT